MVMFRRRLVSVRGFSHHPHTRTARSSYDFPFWILLFIRRQTKDDFFQLSLHTLQQVAPGERKVYRSKSAKQTERRKSSLSFWWRGWMASCNPPGWSTILQHYRFAWIAVHQNPFQGLSDFDKRNFTPRFRIFFSSLQKVLALFRKDFWDFYEGWVTSKCASEWAGILRMNNSPIDVKGSERKFGRITWEIISVTGCVSTPSHPPLSTFPKRFFDKNSPQSEIK